VSCFHPLEARRFPGGSISILGPLGSDIPPFKRLGSELLILPCGKCDYCLMERSRQWAVRCIHEAQMHKHNCFLTLTYSEEYLPSDFSLDYCHFQLFMKRLRRYFKVPVRFYMCGEYGEKTHRPHYHACIFGIDFSDKVFWKMTAAGHPIYRSALLESLWKYGHSSIGELTFETAAYTARYLLKKVNGDKANEHYKAIEVTTGEIYQRKPEFTHMSLKPGIGANWFGKFQCDVFPHDRVIVRGVRTKPPRYYDKLLDRVDPELLVDLKEDRIEEALKRSADNTQDRLNVKEKVFQARTSRLKRGFTE
jgi:hypothetical protein